MMTFAIKVRRPSTRTADLFLVCAPSHTDAIALLDARLGDDAWQVEGSAELREGLAEFIGMQPDEVMVWAPLSK